MISPGFRVEHKKTFELPPPRFGGIPFQTPRDVFKIRRLKPPQVEVFSYGTPTGTGSVALPKWPKFLKPPGLKTFFLLPIEKPHLKIHV